MVFVDTPRSSAGPDPRASLSPEQYECLTVPVVPKGEPTVLVGHLAPDVRPARVLMEGWELRGPAASDLGSICAADAEGASG